MKQSPHTNSGAGRIWLYVLALILLAAGLFLTIGGAVLVARGGSWYFLIAGVVIVASAGLVARGRSAGAWLFLAVFAGTVLWALADVGLDYWGLISRLLALTFLSTVMVFSVPLLRKVEGKASCGKPAVIGGAVLGVLGLLGFGSMFSSHPEVVAAVPAARTVPVAPGQEQKNWAHYGNDAGTGRFAALDQINVTNVSQLQEAWTFQTGDIPQSTGAGAEDQLTPMQIGDKRQGSVETAPARGQPGQSHHLQVAQDRQAVCGHLGRWWPAVARPGRLRHRLRAALRPGDHVPAMQSCCSP